MELGSRLLYFTLLFIFCVLVLTEGVTALGAQSGFSQDENYTYIENNWEGSIEINFDEYWEGEHKWGDIHMVYPVQIDTKKLIQQDKLRDDCTDIRVASEGQLLGTRVQDNTCNTSETWVYFGNPELKDGLKFDENKSIEEIEIFYGNQNAGLSKYTTSVYNDDISTLLKPESALGVYYGHHTTMEVSKQTTKEYNKRDIPEQKWSVDFQNDGSHGDVDTDYIRIKDDDGNYKDFNSGDTYTITTSNAPSWLEQGDTVSVYFKSESGGCYESSCETKTSNQKSAVWGYPVEFSSPRPAKSNTGSPVDTTSTDLEIYVDEPNGNDVTVTFYNASDGSSIGSETISDSGTASTKWSGLNDGQSYSWYATGCSSNCKQTDSNYEFDVNGFPEIENVEVTDAGDHHAFDIEARVTDANGYNDLEDCEITAVDQSSNSHDYGDVGFESGSGNEAYCRHRISFNDGSNWDHLSTIDFDINISDSKNQDSYSGTHTFPNHGPSLGSDPFSYEDYSTEHAFNVSATVTDVDAISSNEIISQCEFEFEDDEGNLVTETVNIDYNSGDTAQCSYSNVNSSMPYPSDIDGGFEPNEEITTNLTVEDIHGNSEMAIGTHSIPNSPPQSGSSPISPAEGSWVSGTANLEVDVSDSERDPYNLTFIDVDTGNIIDVVEDAHTLTYPSTDWDASLGENSWKVGLNDSYDYTESNEWEFTRVISDRFRLRQSIQYDYSSLILTEEGTGNLFYEVTNLHPNEKRVRVNLSSSKGIIEPVFLRNNDNTTTFNLQQDQTETLQVQVNADDVVSSEQDKLVITNTDLDIGTTDTQELEVLVRGSEAEFRDAPGLTSIYLVFIGLASVLLFGLSM